MSAPSRSTGLKSSNKARGQPASAGGIVQEKSISRGQLEGEDVDSGDEEMDRKAAIAFAKERKTEAWWGRRPSVSGEKGGVSVSIHADSHIFSLSLLVLFYLCRCERSWLVGGGEMSWTYAAVEAQKNRQKRQSFHKIE